MQTSCMTALNGCMMNVPFRPRNPNTALTVLSVDHSSIRNTLFGSHSIARAADADWIGADRNMNTEQCKGCVYWNSANGMKKVDHFCHYLLVNGKMRPREGEKCLGRKDLETCSGRRMKG